MVRDQLDAHALSNLPPVSTNFSNFLYLHTYHTSRARAGGIIAHMRTLAATPCTGRDWDTLCPPPCIRCLHPQCRRQSKFQCPNASVTFHMCLNDVIYLAATNATRNELIMGIFSYFFPKLSKYKGNIKTMLTYSNTQLKISGLSQMKNKLFSV